MQIAEELTLVDGLVEGVQPLSVPQGSAVQVVAKNNVPKPQQAGSGVSRTVRESTVIKKIPNRPSTSFYLQAGAFSKNADAERLKDRLSQSGMDAFVRTVAKDGKALHLSLIHI